MGAIACERVFYGENSDGVYGDLGQATNLATHMVGLVEWARTTSTRRSAGAR